MSGSCASKVQALPNNFHKQDKSLRSSTAFERASTASWQLSLQQPSNWREKKFLARHKQLSPRPFSAGT